jgi:ribosome-binding factor A
MSKRTQQIGEEIQRILSETLQFEMKDPRVGFATVTRVEVSGDLQHANVYISIMDETERSDTMMALERAKGFLRRQVAQSMSHLRFVPELHLRLDTSLDYSIRIGEVLRAVEQERAERERQAPSAADETPNPPPTE